MQLQLRILGFLSTPILDDINMVASML